MLEVVLFSEHRDMAVLIGIELEFFVDVRTGCFFWEDDVPCDTSTVPECKNYKHLVFLLILLTIKNKNNLHLFFASPNLLKRTQETFYDKYETTTIEGE